jgi:hypothetical protein
MKVYAGALALLLVACSPAQKSQQAAADSTAASAAPDNSWSGPRACELIAAADINKVTSLMYKPGVVTNDYAGDSQCRYERADTTKVAVMVTLHGRGKIDPYRLVPMTSSVPGLGDEAYWNEGNAQLAIRKDSSVLSIAFMPAPAKKSWAVSLARIALSKFK